MIFENLLNIEKIKPHFFSFNTFQTSDSFHCKALMLVDTFVT